jgi:UDP-N-acetylglucosamine 2-epimerase (non-hydrolysing)
MAFKINKITLIAGARPNFIKIAPIIRAMEAAVLRSENISYRLVHTGQHFDSKMSDTFFKELNIPEPHANLGCGGGTQAEQTAAIMVAFERDLMANPADLVLVVGDVTSTLACSIVAKKMGSRVAHVEAGIRSFDLAMPEEINRIVTDSLTDYFFTTTRWAGENLRATGVPDNRIFFVGNVMIDTLLEKKQEFQKPKLWNEIALNERSYLMMTLHRPSNVDDKEKLRHLINEITLHSNNLPVIFPIHPRTKKMFSTMDGQWPNLHTVDPMGYLNFNFLVQHCKCVITDSGGITEETTVMGVPCITLRDSTERPETVSEGTNELIGTNPSAIGPALRKLFLGDWKKGTIPELWDGHSAERIVKLILQING